MNVKKIGIIILKILLITVATVIILLCGLNIYKRIAYGEFYSKTENIGSILGLNDGYIPQGLTEYKDGFITAGYMDDDSASRIYVDIPRKEDATGKETRFQTFVTLYSCGKPFYGHTGGLQYEGGYFYLANESDGLYKFKANFIDNITEDGNNIVDIGAPILLNNHTSFVYSNSDFLYVGEFNNDKEYKCINEITYNGTTHKAIITKYNLNDLKTPIAIYSIPNEIQGVCVTKDGTMVLSRSYSVYPSNLMIYEQKDIIKTDLIYDNTPVYFLQEPTKNIKAPAMTEDLDYYNDKILVHFESASNKYFFGKFFFDFKIKALEL